MFSPAVSVREQEIEKFTPNQSFGLDPRVYQFHHSYHFIRTGVVSAETRICTSSTGIPVTNFFNIITSATLGEPQFPRCLRR